MTGRWDERATVPGACCCSRAVPTGTGTCSLADTPPPHWDCNGGQHSPGIMKCKHANRFSPASFAQPSEPAGRQGLRRAPSRLACTDELREPAQHRSGAHSSSQNLVVCMLVRLLLELGEEPSRVGVPTVPRTHAVGRREPQSGAEGRHPTKAKAFADARADGNNNLGNSVETIGPQRNAGRSAATLRYGSESCMHEAVNDASRSS